MVTLEAVAADEGPAFPEPSVTDPEASWATTVPSVVQVAVTVIELPDNADGEKEQLAVPVFVKSPVAIPETDSLKLRVYDRVRLDDGEDGATQLAVGGLVSAEVPVICTMVLP
jgi:hypothetical protein